MNRQEFSLRMGRLITQRGITESKMSEDLGFHRTYIHNITAGRTLPKMEPFFRICEYLGLSPAEFFLTGEEERERAEQTTQAFLALTPENKLALREVIRRLK